MSQRPDLRQRRAVLEHEWSRWVPRLSVPGARPGGTATLRHEVTESWARSLGSVDPGRDSAPVADGGQVHQRWTSSPLYRPVSALAGELHSIAEDAGFVTAVTDESGTILWTCGGPTMRRQAERVNFAPGGRWDEQAMGTNALSLALRTGRPSSVFSAEHLVSALHGWVCYCAPVHGRDGRVLGVLDLSTTWDRSHPLAMSTVRTLVSTIEARLTTEVSRPVRLRLTCLGSEHAAHGDGPSPCAPDSWRSSPSSHSNPTASPRAAAGGPVRRPPGHVLHLQGGDLPPAPRAGRRDIPRHYALTEPVSCDAGDVLRALEQGDTDTALRRYGGPLLPRSEAPGIEEWRTRLEVAVREAVLASTRPEHALRYGERAPYDAEVHEHALRLLGPGDTRRAIARGRLATALRG